jgi:hypothetical protein
MATNCTNCGCSNINCGCKDSFLTTPPPCPTPEGCPDRQPCSEIFDAQCVVYTGPDLQCGLDDVVLTNTPLNLALEDIIGYFCENTTVSQNLICGSDTVVTAGTPIVQAISDVVEYFCENLSGDTVVVDGGNGVNVTSNTVGDITTYTIETLGAFLAQSFPEPLPNQVPAAGLNLYSGVTQNMAEQYDDDNAYSQVTGLWTCPADGRYNLSFYVHLSNETISVVTGFASGMVVAGIVNEGTVGYYAINTMAVNQIVRHIDITGQALGIELTAGTQLKFNILNLTNVNYSFWAGDVARWGVQRVG